MKKEFIARLPVKKLWGVGEKTYQKLLRFHVHTIGNLAGVEPHLLQKNFGKWGIRLHELANGIDDREVCTKHVRKSISEEKTFPEDTANSAKVQETLRQISINLARKMQHKKLGGRTVVLKIRFENFDTFTRTKTVSSLVLWEANMIFQTALALYRNFILINVNCNGLQKIRLVGLAISNLENKSDDIQQLDLFNRCMAD